MKQIIVFTEERSIVPVIEHMFRALGYDDVAALVVVPHDGISDLRTSLPRKLKAWRNPQARFLIVCDGDSVDCKERKNGFVEIANSAGKGRSTIVRIVGQELEAWFLGDRKAMHKAKVLDISKNPAALRGDPDKIPKPSAKLDKLLNGYRKTRSAREIAPHMNCSRNISCSFQHTMNALKKLMEG